MFSPRTRTKYTIRGNSVDRVYPSGYYVMKYNGDPLMADTITGLRKLVKQKADKQKELRKLIV